MSAGSRCCANIGNSTLSAAYKEILCRGKDTLGLMPTGGGKSITFQIPSLLLPGTCIVVTPLIALMKDQVARLKQMGIKATAIYSGMTRDDIIRSLENCILGGIKEFLEEKKIDNLKEIERRAVTTESKSLDNAPSENKLAYEARKELSKKIKKIERSIADTEKEIEQLENLLADIEAKFAEGNSSESLVKEYNSKKHLLDQKMYEWEIQNEEIEQLKSM